MTATDYMFVILPPGACAGASGGVREETERRVAAHRGEIERL